MVNQYMELAGGFDFAKNSNRQTTSWVNQAGIYCAVLVANKYPYGEAAFDDVIDAKINRMIVGYANREGYYFEPAEIMAEALAELTGIKPTKKHLEKL